MYKDGWLEYNRYDLEKAITEAKKVSSISSSLNSKCSTKCAIPLLLGSSSRVPASTATPT